MIGLQILACETQGRGSLRLARSYAGSLTVTLRRLTQPFALARRGGTPQPTVDSSDMDIAAAGTTTRRRRWVESVSPGPVSPIGSARRRDGQRRSGANAC